MAKAVDEMALFIYTHNLGVLLRGALKRSPMAAKNCSARIVLSRDNTPSCATQNRIALVKSTAGSNYVSLEGHLVHGCGVCDV